MAVAAAMLAMGGNAVAFEIDTANEDVSARWGDTVRYNVAKRVEGRDIKIGNYAIADEGTYSFDNGDTVANRVDVLSELDFVYKKIMGFRGSYAA